MNSNQQAHRTKSAARAVALALSAGAAATLCAVSASANERHRAGPEWGAGELVIAGGGCPIETPDTRSVMFASGRDGGAGSFDIWVIDRPALDGEWSEPKNLAGPVNTADADFCPAPYGRTLYFVSSRAHPEACGGADIYVTRQSPAGDWSEPTHLPCAPEGPNTAATERSPSLVETRYGTFLFFSTAGAGGDDDIHVSVQNLDDGNFGPGHVVHGLSKPEYDDQMPTVRAKPTGGFEVTFNSNRPGTEDDPAYGGQDVYWSRARFLPFWWSTPTNAGANVNTDANETRASLSVDLQRLYVGRGDIYVSERE